MEVVAIWVAIVATVSIVRNRRRLRRRRYTRVEVCRAPDVDDDTVT